MSHTPQELAALASPRLSQWLIEQARDARSHVVEDDFLALREIFTVVRTAAGLAKGTNRDLLEVAEAFFAPLARNQLGRQQIELRQFLKSSGDSGEEFLRHLLDEKSMSVDASQATALRSAVARLEEFGVLLSQAGFLRIVPAAEPFVRELIDPLAFRLWAKVEQARREAAASPEGHRALVIAGHLGVTEAQAKRFAKKHVVSRRPMGPEPKDLVVPHGGMFDQQPAPAETSPALGQSIDTVFSDELGSAMNQNIEHTPVPNPKDRVTA